jgi:hypothetical protein
MAVLPAPVPYRDRYPSSKSAGDQNFFPLTAAPLSGAAVGGFFDWVPSAE